MSDDLEALIIRLRSCGRLLARSCGSGFGSSERGRAAGELAVIALDAADRLEADEAERIQMDAYVLRLSNNENTALTAALAEVKRLRGHGEGLVHALLDMDHSRGSQGREYACSCDYDDTVYNLATSFRAALTQQSQAGGDE